MTPVSKRAQLETLDSLYRKIKAIVKKYVDADDFHVAIIAADVIFSYFQDKLGLTHYLFFVGGNASGKSNRLELFRLLAYRNMTSSDMTPANIFRYLGWSEEGIGTICEDEADNIDEDREKLKIYKNGNITGRPVLRMDDDGGIRQNRYFTFCFKAFAAERLPDSVKARGFLQRCIELPCMYGFPDYDIMEVVNNAGAEKFIFLLEEVEEVRSLLLIYRLSHFNEIIPDIDLNIKNREKQLFKPILRLFQKTETMKELLLVISEYINERRIANANSLHAYVYGVITGLIQKNNTTQLKSEDIWNEVTNSEKCPGEFIPHKPMMYESADYGPISRKQITQICKDVFSAKPPKHRSNKSELVFDKRKLKQVRSFYSNIKVKVEEDEEDEEDVGIERYLRGKMNDLKTSNENKKLSKNSNNNSIKLQKPSTQNNKGSTGNENDATPLTHEATQPTQPTQDNNVEKKNGEYTTGYRDHSKLKKNQVETSKFMYGCYACQEFVYTGNKEAYRKHCIETHADGKLTTRIIPMRNTGMQGMPLIPLPCPFCEYIDVVPTTMEDHIEATHPEQHHFQMTEEN